MMKSMWRDKATTQFTCQKRSVSASKAMVVTNHPLASSAAIEMISAGGNAIDATIAALFTLSVVEPMMVGIFGGGTSLIRLANGEEVIIDGLAHASRSIAADVYQPVSDSWPGYMEVAGRRNAIGATSIAVPGNLQAWCQTLTRYGRLSLDTVIAPAIRYARNGFQATPYLCNCIASTAKDLAGDAGIASVFMPGGQPLKPGEMVRQPAYAETLEIIAREGYATMYSGSLGAHIVASLAEKGAYLTAEDLAAYTTIDRTPVSGMYRGMRLVGAPPPCSGGVHVIQMLNLLEGYDIGAMGFGSKASVHLLLEVLKIAASDRRALTADPDFFDVPVKFLMSKTYADERRKEIAADTAGSYTPATPSHESQNTTHVTIADDEGNIVSSTQTINSLFGAKMLIPGTGIIPNNYMYLFDPHPGNTLSIQPGKRVTSTQSPLIAYGSDNKPAFALGLPGGPRLYGSAMQGVVNIIDHGMTLQEAVEAPRVWTQGQDAELEPGFDEAVVAGLEAMGHPVAEVPHIAGGMCAVQFDTEHGMTGASCWRADGTPIGVGGGLAREGTQFWPDYTRYAKPLIKP